MTGYGPDYMSGLADMARRIAADSGITEWVAAEHVRRAAERLHLQYAADILEARQKARDNPPRLIRTVVWRLLGYDYERDTRMAIHLLRREAAES